MTKKATFKKATFKKEHEHALYKGYLDWKQIDYDKSYQIASRPSVVGCRLVYQNIVMLDGTVYPLLSQSTSTAGIFDTNIKGKGLTQREVKAIAGDAPFY